LNKIYYLEVYDLLELAEENIYSALDCSLDENFTKLKIRILFPATDESFSTLMSIIAHRSPKLRELTIKFRHNATDKKASDNNFEHPDSAIMQESRLHCLKSMTFSNDEYSTRYRQTGFTSILRAVGRYCSSLSELTVYGMCFKAKDIIDFVMDGEMSDVLFPTEHGGWSDSVFDGLCVPPRFRNPLCFTLEELFISCDCQKCDSSSAIAFLLPHLPQLRITELSSPSDLHTVIRLLYERSKTRKVQQAKFEEACQEAASRILFKSALTTLPAILPGWLLHFLFRLLTCM